MQKHKVTLAMIFLYYSMAVRGTWKSTEIMALNMEQFRIFILDICILNPTAKSYRNMNELDSVFVVRASLQISAAGVACHNDY